MRPVGADMETRKAGDIREKCSTPSPQRLIDSQHRGTRASSSNCELIETETTGEFKPLTGNLERFPVSVQQLLRRYQTGGEVGIE